MTTPNWIKMRTDLRNHPKVVRMASALKADRLRIIGGLWAVWATFDTHSADGLLEGYTLEALDEDLGWRGFSRALQAVGWLVEDPDNGLQIPEFEEHNGASAKRRASDTKRKSSDRDADKTAHGSWNPSGQMSAPDADSSGTRVRVERESNTPLPPDVEIGRAPPPVPRIGPPPGFVAFWAAWPSSERKGGKAECAKVWEKARLEIEAGVIVAHVQALARSEGWTKDAGRFVPAPLVYLRGRRWDGAELSASPAANDPFSGAL